MLGVQIAVDDVTHAAAARPVVTGEVAVGNVI